MASSLVLGTAVLYFFVSAVLSITPSGQDDTWMAMLKGNETVAWCPSIIVTANWVLSDQTCAISEALGLLVVAGVRLWSERENGQQRYVDQVFKTPFGRMRGAHFIEQLQFNENVSFIRLADNELPKFGMACRASGGAEYPGETEPRLVSQTVIAIPGRLCPAFGVVHVGMCVRSYPWHFPCNALPLVWVSCQRLITGWCDYAKPCSGHYQTHLAQPMHPIILWLEEKITNDTLQTGHLMISSQPPNPAVMFLPLLVPLSYLLTAMSSPSTA